MGLTHTHRWRQASLGLAGLALAWAVHAEPEQADTHPPKVEPTVVEPTVESTSAAERRPPPSATVRRPIYSKRKSREQDRQELDTVAKKLSDLFEQSRAKAGNTTVIPSKHAPIPQLVIKTRVAPPPPSAVKAAVKKPSAPIVRDPQSWAYSGPNGPQSWSELHPDFAACGQGKRQSPIDLQAGMALDLQPIQFHYYPLPFTEQDTGRTIQVSMGLGNYIVVRGERYDLQHVQFHMPAEERIEGRSFEMAAHLMHKNHAGRQAVVVVLFERGEPDAMIQTVWNDLPLERQQSSLGSSLFNPRMMLPAEHTYYAYMGSLTTPPCTEGVLRLVMKQPRSISQDQLDIFAQFYPMNARPIQAAHGRVVQHSR